MRRFHSGQRPVVRRSALCQAYRAPWRRHASHARTGSGNGNGWARRGGWATTRLHQVGVYDARDHQWRGSVRTPSGSVKAISVLGHRQQQHDGGVGRQHEPRFELREVEALRVVRQQRHHRAVQRCVHQERERDGELDPAHGS